MLWVHKDDAAVQSGPGTQDAHSAVRQSTAFGSRHSHSQARSYKPSLRRVHCVPSGSSEISLVANMKHKFTHLFLFFRPTLATWSSTNSSRQGLVMRFGDIAESASDFISDFIHYLLHPRIFFKLFSWSVNY